MKAVTVRIDRKRGGPTQSPLRAEQLAVTRRMLLEALLAEIAEKDIADLQIADIAARAGIAVRTVYRHFPTKDALLDAFWEWWINERFGVPDDQPVPLETFPDHLRRIYEAFDRTEPVMRAFIYSRAGRELRDRTRHRRVKMINETLREAVAAVPPDDRSRVLAVFQTLFSVTTWDTLRHFRGLSGEEAGDAVAWVARVLLEELRRDPHTMKKTRKPAKERKS
jgi:AcrR family transcriptional regulator